MAAVTAGLYHIIAVIAMGKYRKNPVGRIMGRKWLPALPTQLVDEVLLQPYSPYDRRMNDKKWGKLPHAGGASPKPLSSRAGSQRVFRPLRWAARALPLTCELLKKFDQNFYFGVHIVFQQTVSALPAYIILSQ